MPSLWRVEKPAAVFAGAATLWLLTVLRWFDAGELFRPAWLAALPAGLFALPALVLAVAWLRLRPALAFPPAPGSGLWLVVALAVLFRLPLAILGAAGYTTADGALSGIVALRIRDGLEHLVFVPHVAYSGSLKSHLTAPLAAVIDPARAFALTSVFFYALFVAAVHRLALLAGGPDEAGARRTALLAGLYVAFAPAFVTQYSLSNDGNYVEVLALGTWALLLAARWVSEPPNRPLLALVLGILLGLAFWCHILAVMHIAAVGLVILVAGRRKAVPSLPSLVGGWSLGYAPGLLWNMGQDWDSFAHLIPGASAGTQEGGRFLDHVWGVIADQGPILLGYEPGGHAVAVDMTVKALALAAGVLVMATLFRKATGSAAGRVLLTFAFLNVVVAVAALPYLAGNPRYLLFLMAPIAVLLGAALADGWRRWLMGLVVAFGALGSLDQSLGKIRADHEWRRFVGDLERAGVRACFTDFYLATKINFLSEDRVVCSAKLGPTTTEYFFDYRRKVENAPEAALVAVNPTNAEKLERRLERLGVTYERRDWMKPVLLRLSRKVDPEELFPDRSFPLR